MGVSSFTVEQCLAILAKHDARLVTFKNSVVIRRRRAEGHFPLGEKSRKRVAELLLKEFGAIDAVNWAIGNRKGLVG